MDFGFAQNADKPQDFLPASFHKERREAVRKLLPARSMAVFFANPVRNRSNDVDYHYHQDPDFYYLTGYPEPNAVLIIFSEDQKGSDGKTYNEVVFVQKRDVRAEQWTGKRLGVEGVKAQLGLTQVFEGSTFKNFPLDPFVFDKILILGFQNDVRPSKDEGDLSQLIQHFKTKTNYQGDQIGADRYELYSMIKTTTVQNNANVAQYVGRAVEKSANLKEDKVLQEFLAAQNTEQRIKVAQNINIGKHDSKALVEMMKGLRETKLPEEIKLLRKAINITAVGQVEMMKAMHPNMSESEIQGIHEFVYKKYGSEYEGYPSIVGGGHNGCVLHYIENNKPKVGNDLVLMDLGAEYHGYTADVTRTIPANGKFSAEQKAIYEIVFAAQEAGIQECKVGNSFRSTHLATSKVVNEGLARLGIIATPETPHNYFPHGTSHYLGLDVHDRGTYGNFKPNTIITVEPGIYIPENSPCDKKWWGIAVRIEDDILITDQGFELLSAGAPRKVEEIEKLMKEKSIFEEYKLPKLD